MCGYSEGGVFIYDPLMCGVIDPPPKPKPKAKPKPKPPSPPRAKAKPKPTKQKAQPAQPKQKAEPKPTKQKAEPKVKFKAEPKAKPAQAKPKAQTKPKAQPKTKPKEKVVKQPIEVKQPVAKKVKQQVKQTVSKPAVKKKEKQKVCSYSPQGVTIAKPKATSSSIDLSFLLPAICALLVILAVIKLYIALVPFLTVAAILAVTLIVGRVAWEIVANQIANKKAQSHFEQVNADFSRERLIKQRMRNQGYGPRPFNPEYVMRCVDYNELSAPLQELLAAQPELAQLPADGSYPALEQRKVMAQIANEFQRIKARKIADGELCQAGTVPQLQR